jgi:hypothetical protein
MRINETVEFLKPFIDEDPLLIGLMCDAITSIDKLKESIIMLANKIKDYPMLVPLLLK